MALKVLTNGTLNDADEVMENFNFILETFNGNTTSPYIECGTSDLSPTGLDTPTVSVTFANEFDSTPVVVVTKSGGYRFHDRVDITAKSTTGFTVTFENQGGSGQGPSKVDWIAIGTRTR